MAEMMIGRRDFLGSLAALGAIGALPSAVLAKARAGDWAAVQAYLDATVAKGNIPGLAAAIGRGTAAPVFLNAGTLAKDSKVKVNEDSLWRVYSMTKPITGMAAMLLVEDGDLKLDQPIADFIPGFAKMQVLTAPETSLDSRPAVGLITVRHLLTHTAGLGYSIVSKGPLLEAYQEEGILPARVSRTRSAGMLGMIDHPTAPSLKEFAERLAKLPLIADPGTKWSYSVSLDLLGRVIEIAAGRPFDAFVQKRLFDPLGMKSSFWQVPAKEARRLTTNYGVSPEGAVALDPGATSIYLDPPAFPFGGAGLVMSARDYDRFLQMLAGYGNAGGRQIMKTATAQRAMSNLLPAGVDTTGSWMVGQGFGAGGRVSLTDAPGGQSAGTFGWGGAAATIAWVDPVRGLRASGFAQYMPDQAYGFSEGFAKSVYAALK